jgi:hypothetical protein
MNCPDISSAVNDLPVPLPQEGDVSGVSVQAAVAVCEYITHDIEGYILIYRGIYCMI